LLFTRLAERRRVQLVLLCISGYLGVLLVNTVQTYSGRGPFDLSVPMAPLLIVSIAAVVAAYALAGRELLRRPAAGIVAADDR
jgi:hypothetical protein